MVLKNTFKIMFLNFPTILKSCLYKLLVIAVVLLAGYGVLLPVINQGFEAGLVNQVYTFFHDGVFAFNFDVIFSSSNEIIANLTAIMEANIGFTWNFIALFVILAVVQPILLGLSKVAEYGVLFGKLSSNTKYDLTTCFFEHVGHGILYRLYRVIFSIPIVVACLALCYLLPTLLSGPGGTIIAIFLIIISVSLLCSFFMTLFLIYEPNLLFKGLKPWQALNDSIKNVQKYGFFKVFFIIFVFCIVAFLFNAFFGAFSYGIALVLTLPITIQFSNVLRMVLCYDCLGMDYYIDEKNVCVTKKSKQRNTIEEMADII